MAMIRQNSTDITVVMVCCSQRAAKRALTTFETEFMREYAMNRVIFVHAGRKQCATLTDLPGAVVIFTDGLGHGQYSNITPSVRNMHIGFGLVLCESGDKG